MISIHTSAFFCRGGEFIIIRDSLIGLLTFEDTCTQSRNQFYSSYSMNDWSSLLLWSVVSCGLGKEDVFLGRSNALNYVSLALSPSWSFWQTSISRFQRASQWCNIRASLSFRSAQISFCMSSKTSLLILTVRRYSFKHRIASPTSPPVAALRPSLFLTISSRLRQSRTSPSEQEFSTDRIIQIITVSQCLSSGGSYYSITFMQGSYVLTRCYLLNIILKLTVSMGKDKKQAGVARSKFIDRIKSSADFQLDHKENMNLNDIRQSGYKLPRSKSNPRYDHSLERKQPIRITKDALNSSTEPILSETMLKNALKQYTSNAPTANNTIKLNTYQNECFSHEKQLLSERSCLDCSGEFNHTELQQEEESLDIVKSIWESTTKMKDKGRFKDEMGRIQGILKEIIIQMAKPKFNSLQESSSISLQAPEVKFSPFQNVASYKESKKCSNNSSTNQFRSRTRRQQQARCAYTSHESEAEDELEFKKIMYILEEKSKLTRFIPEFSSSGKEGRELKEMSDILNIKTSCYSSSFNCSSRDPSGQTMRQFQKVSNSRSNERVFLKNIVKKAKTSVSNVEEAEKQMQTLQKRSKSDISFINNEDEQFNDPISEEEESEQESVQQPAESFTQKSNKYSFIRSKGDPIKIETLETLQDESESKRAVLNQIITMLNNKYHKNIKLEPRKF